MIENLLTVHDVLSITGIRSRNTLYNKIIRGEFPKPIRIGKRQIRFKQSEVQAWIDAQKYRDYLA